MSYTLHNFVNGEVIDAGPINEMDQQIQTNETNIGNKFDKSNVYNGLDKTASGFALDARQGKALNDGKLATSLKGAANGVAELDANGKVPSIQLPSYVDDVIEGYYYNSKFYKEAAHTTEITGETGKIYVDLVTNNTYRWSGSQYTLISESLALGETSSTAYRGDRGKTAYDHATDASRLTTAQTEGLYKIATTAEGHVGSATAVQKSDITGLGIPAQDTMSAAYYTSYAHPYDETYNDHIINAGFTNYKLRNNNVFPIIFGSAVTLSVMAGKINRLYLNVNNTGDKSLYIDGASPTITQSITISAGIYWVYYYQPFARYYMRTDGISVPGINGQTIGEAMSKSVDTSISAGTTSTNLPTSSAVAGYVDGKLLPDVDPTDNDKFLRVVNGAWAAVTVPAASGNSF